MQISLNNEKRNTFPTPQQYHSVLATAGNCPSARNSTPMVNSDPGPCVCDFARMMESTRLTSCLRSTRMLWAGITELRKLQRKLQNLSPFLVTEESQAGKAYLLQHSASATEKILEGKLVPSCVYKHHSYTPGRMSEPHEQIHCWLWHEVLLCSQVPTGNTK